MTQLSLFNDGLYGTIAHSETVKVSNEKIRADISRIRGQLNRVKSVMENGGWWTLEELKKELEKRYSVNYGEASISARIRELDAHDLRERSRNLYEYRMVK